MRFDLILALLSSCNVYAVALAHPANNAQEAIVYYNLPTPNSGPCDFDDGPNGRDVWYYNQLHNKVGVINTQSGKVQDWTIPWTRASYPQPVTAANQTAQVCAVRRGMDGLIYVVTNDRSELAQVNPQTYKIRILQPISYTPPAGTVPALHEMLAYDNMLVFTHFYERIVSQFSYRDNSTLTMRFPSEHSPLGVQYGFQAYVGGRQQVVWLTEFSNNTIAQNPLTYGRSTSFPVPLPGGGFPSSFRSTTENGRYLWANAFTGGGLIRFDKTNASPLKVYTYPDGAGGANTFPQQNDVDPSGNIWISSYNLKRLAYLTPSTGKWTTIQLPQGNAATTGDKFVPVHYGKPLNAMWFTSVGTNQVGAYKL